MGKRRKKSFLKGLAISVVAVAGLVMVLLGTFSLDWLSYETSSIVETSDAFVLSELPESDSYNMMNILAYVTLGLSAVTAVLAVACGILRLRFSSLKMLSGLLTIVATILLIVFTLKYCKDTNSFSIDFIVTFKGEFVLAVGSMLAFAGGFVSGIAGLVPSK